MEKGVIDRIVAGRHAVLLVGDDEKEMVIPIIMLPAGLKEGDWVKVEWQNGQIRRVERDPDETEERKKGIAAKLNLLKKGQHSKFKK